MEESTKRGIELLLIMVCSYAWVVPLFALLMELSKLANK